MDSVNGSRNETRTNSKLKLHDNIPPPPPPRVVLGKNNVVVVVNYGAIDSLG
jgi:hypothetical protein